MFGGSGSASKDGDPDPDAASIASPQMSPSASIVSDKKTSPKPVSKSASKEPSPNGEKPSGNGSPGRPADASAEKKRRSSGVGAKSSSFLASAKNALHFSPSPNSAGFMKSATHTNSNTNTDQQNPNHTPLQKLGKQDPALSVPQGQHNNSAGESLPGPRATFEVGVWEDRNKKCRRTMEDTHAFLYNFLYTPAPAVNSEPSADLQRSTDPQSSDESGASAPSITSSTDIMETDNGYFAIFDGHAGTFAADWCGKKLHIILEEIIRKNPNTPIPELLDLTFTTVDEQLEKLPVKNSGCTAVTAILRWEDRIANAASATGSTAIAPATIAAFKAAEGAAKSEDRDSSIDPTKLQPKPVAPTAPISGEATHAKLKSAATRSRVLYTANVGDARIVLCRNGKALRLSYDHKGSDENEGKRVASAGGLILNNRVNGVLAVTRALGDAYMKDLVTGHPYTTETVIQPDLDEFIILACDGLWDVCSDQEAVDLVRHELDPVAAAKHLIEYALARFSTDNLSCMIVRLNKSALQETASSKPIGVEGDKGHSTSKVSEVEKIVADAKRKVEEGGAPAVGVSGSNSGKGHDPVVPSAQGTNHPEPPKEEKGKETSPKKEMDEDTSNAKELFKGFALGNANTSMERVEEEPVANMAVTDSPEVDVDSVEAVPHDRGAAIATEIPQPTRQDA